MDELDSLLGDVRSAYTPDVATKSQVRGAVASAITGGAIVGGSESIGAAATGVDGSARGLSLGADAELSGSGFSAWSRGALSSVVRGKWALLVVATGGLLFFDGTGSEATTASTRSTREPVAESDSEPAQPFVQRSGRERLGSSNVPLAVLPTGTQKTRVSRSHELVDLKPVGNVSKKTPEKPSAPTPAAVEAGSLIAELRLMREASTQLHAGSPKKTLELLAEHRRRYPKSVVRSERHGLYVLARCLDNPTKKTVLAAEQFLSGTPGSPLASHIKKSCIK